MNQARWIGLASPLPDSEIWKSEGMPGDLQKRFGGDRLPASPQLRKILELPPGIRVCSAEWRLCALGYVDPVISGHRLLSCALNPAVIDFRYRRPVLTLTVPPESFGPGRNELELNLGRGWYARGLPGVTHDGPLVKAELRLELSNGETRVIPTDETWQGRRGPDRPLGTCDWGHFVGEEFDEQSPAADWGPLLCPTVAEVPEVAQECPLTQVAESRSMIQWTQSADGSWLGDLGICATAQFEIEINLDPNEPPGVIELEYGDKILPDGSRQTFGQMDRWLTGGAERGVFRNRFEYHAFRYVRLTGLPAHARIVEAKAHLVRNDYPVIGQFACSDELLNRIFSTVRHTLGCLFQGGVIQDCPHRERLGYGDGQAVLDAASYCYDVSGLLRKWFRDWQDVQDPVTGNLPHTAPSPYAAGGGPAWSALGLHLARQLERVYGDDRLLPESFVMAEGLLDFLESQMRDGVLVHYGSESWGFLGDWVAPGKGMMPEDRVDAGSTQFFNNCVLIRLLEEGIRLANHCSAPARVTRWSALRDQLRSECHRRWFDSERSTYANGEPTYLASALLAGVVPPEAESVVAETLRERILKTDGGHVNTGVLGTWFLLQLCRERGWNGLVYSMATGRTFPGWGYMLEQGATTIWEEWNGDNSQIHSCHLSIGQWFFEGIAGIRAASPGYREILLRPAITLPLEWFESTYESASGKIRIAWRRKVATGILSIDVPVPARLELPSDVTILNLNLSLNLPAGTHELSLRLPATLFPE